MERRCSTSSYRDGPWHCGTYDCPKDGTCTATQRNVAEAAWLARETTDPTALELRGITLSYGLPVYDPSISGARDALRDQEYDYPVSLVIAAGRGRR